MNRGFLIIIAVLIVDAITNPDEARHKEVLRNKMKLEMIQAFMDEKEIEKLNNLDAISFMFGTTVVQKFVDNIVSTDNYIVFSLMKATWGGETKIIGVGLFGNVLLLKDLEKFEIEV